MDRGVGSRQRASKVLQMKGHVKMAIDAETTYIYRMKLTSVIALVCCFGLLTANAQTAKTGYQNIDAAKAKEMLTPEATKKLPLTVLDVRTADEFKEGHIAGAKQIDFFGADFEKELTKLDRKKNYLLHCRSGGRSTKAMAVMKKLGFTSVYHLDGGMLAWTKADGKVTKK